MERNCDHCGTTYLAKRATSRYCSGACRTKAGRKPASAVATVEQIHVTQGTTGLIESTTLDELMAVGRVNTSAGQRAMALARLLDAPPQGTLGAVAGWSREHGAAMDKALAGAEVKAAASTLDEIRARRDAKRHA